MRRCLIYCLIAALPQCLIATSRQVFRSNVDVVSLNVTVTDAEGHLVRTLEKSAFHAFEDGVEQDLTYFAAGTQPIALSILLDTSTSMDKKLAIAQEAASGLVRRLTEKDVAQVIDFDSRVQIFQDFTNDTARLEAAIRKMEAGGSTSLYNAIYVALDNLRKTRVQAQAAADIRRQAIVLLSDGEDTTSTIDYEAVLESAKRSEVTIYAVGLRSKQDLPSRGGFNEAEFVLRTLSQETGGRLYLVDQVAQLPAIYQQIADEIANQYVLGYSSKNPKRDGAFRTIFVKVDAAGATARTKRGYYGPSVPK